MVVSHCDNWRLIDARLLQVFVANVNAMLLNEFLKEPKKTGKLRGDGGKSHRDRKRAGSANSESERTA